LKVFNLTSKEEEPMAEKDFDLKGALEYAIHAEIQANEFYKVWADNVTSQLTKKELLELADWEDSHRASLEKYYREAIGEPFKRNPNIVVDPALQVQADEFKNYYSTLRVAAAAYLSEMKAADLYEKLQSKVTEESAKKMFKELAEMERSHMDYALKRYNELRGELEGKLML